MKNDKIKSIYENKVNITSLVKVLYDIDYLYGQINYFDIIFHNRMIFNIKNNYPKIFNCILESTILFYRKLFEFFFFDKNLFNDDDAFAVYYFSEPDHFKEIIDRCVENNNSIKKTLIEFKKFAIEKRGIHVTFNKKMEWKEIIKLYPLFKEIYMEFKKSNIFDINKIKYNDEMDISQIENELRVKINNNFNIGNILENSVTNQDREILDLIKKVYDLENINMKWVIKD